MGSRDADDALLGELDRLAPEMLGEGRPVRLTERLDRLADLDFGGHPWARLLVGCAIGDADPADGRGHRQLTVALRAFRRRGDARGEAYASFVMGCRAIERGDIARATRWWDRARRTAGPTPPGLEIMLAHRCLDAYGAGRLHEALTMSQEAVALARLRGHRRAEATALVNLAFMRLWSGDFAAAREDLDAAEDAFGEVPDPFDRYESPLCFGARGVVRALCGEAADAERDFETAIEIARELRAEWYEAIARTLRAEFTASADHRRARADADAAMTVLRRREDQWWYAWAVHAAGVAALEAGMPAAAQVMFCEALGRSRPVLERARTLLLLGETRLRADQGEEAVAPLREAAETFGAAGARYWEARCCVRLAGADPAGARGWVKRARRIGADDAAHRRLFATEALALAAFGGGRVLRGGRPVEIRTHNTERALFLLALAGPDGLHTEALADRLWPTADADRRRLLGRVRTLLWEVRRVLGPQAWRLERVGPMVRLDTIGIAFDLAEVRAAAERVLAAGDAERASAIAQRLRGPLFARWAYEEWVREEQHANALLADHLTALTSGLTPL